jgi:hypothetical protein
LSPWEPEISRLWTIGLHERQGLSWIGSSQEGLCSREFSCGSKCDGPLTFLSFFFCFSFSLSVFGIKGLK